MGGGLAACPKLKLGALAAVGVVGVGAPKAGADELDAPAPKLNDGVAVAAGVVGGAKLNPPGVEAPPPGS
jgi:hypothetical protein